MRRLAVPRPIAGALLLLAACTSDNRTHETTISPTTEATTTTTSSTTTTAPAPTTTAAPPTVATTAAPATAAPTTTLPPTTTVAIGLPLVLSEQGLGSADFGADPDGVVDYVSSIIRQPTTDSGWVDPSGLGACPGTVARVVTWRDLALFFGDEAESFRGRRHFFGYTYGPPFAAEIDPAGPATDGGITVGSTVQQLQTVFPAAGVNPADDSTPANFTIVEGLSGYLTGAGESDTITQFVGGLVCGE